MPTRLVKNRLFEIDLVATLLFWVVAPFLSRYLVFELDNALTLSISLGIIVAYTPGAWYSLRLPWYQVQASNFITVGIWQFWLVEAFQRIWALISRSLGRPDWMADHLFPAYLIWMGAFAGFFHVVTKEQSDVFPSSNWRLIGVVVSISGIVFYVGYRLIILGR